MSLKGDAMTVEEPMTIEGDITPFSALSAGDTFHAINYYPGGPTPLLIKLDGAGTGADLATGVTYSGFQDNWPCIKVARKAVPA